MKKWGALILVLLLTVGCQANGGPRVADARDLCVSEPEGEQVCIGLKNTSPEGTVMDLRDDGVLTGMVVDDPKYITPSGLKVGSTKSDIKAVFKDVEDSGTRWVVRTDEGSSITFLFDDDNVIGIGMQLSAE